MTESSAQKLDRPVRCIRGVGPKLASLLERKGLRTVEDLLYFLPRAYEDRRRIARIADAQPGARETIVAGVRGAGIRTYGPRRVFEVLFDDGTGQLRAKWFRGNPAYLRLLFKPGVRAILTGVVGRFGAEKDMVHPEHEVLDEGEGERIAALQRIVPVYSETEGLRQKTLRRIVERAVAEYAGDLESPIPEGISGA